MAGTKQIRLGKVSRYIDMLEIKLKVWKQDLDELPPGHFNRGYVKCLEDTIAEIKEEFELEKD